MMKAPDEEKHDACNSSVDGSDSNNAERKDFFFVIIVNNEIGLFIVMSVIIIIGVMGIVVISILKFLYLPLHLSL